MKKYTKIIGIALLSSSLLLSNPTMAQSTDNTTSSTADRTTNHDDTGKWGLAGLLGLLGLLGMRRNDNDRNRITTTNR